MWAGVGVGVGVGVGGCGWVWVGVGVVVVVGVRAYIRIRMYRPKKGAFTSVRSSFGLVVYGLWATICSSSSR